MHPTYDDSGKTQTFFTLQTLRKMLPQVIVKGIPSVSRAVINTLEGGKRYNLLVEGTNLQVSPSAVPHLVGRPLHPKHWDLSSLFCHGALNALCVSRLTPPTL